MKVPKGHNMVVHKYERTLYTEQIIICLSFLLQRNKDLVTALKEVEQVDNPRKLTSWISRGLNQAASSRPPLECKSEENKRCCCLSHQVGVKLTRL